MQRERCIWIGQSGFRYTYTVLVLPCTVRAGQYGNFIFAKRDHAGRWVPIYIGHGELSLACSSGNDLWPCTAGHGATHFHCHLFEDRQACANEQDDLLSRYRNALAPYGCNTVIRHATPPASADEAAKPVDPGISPSDPGISPALAHDDPHPSRTRPKYPT